MDKMSRVVVLPCQSYDEDLVRVAITEGIDLLGGIENLVKKEEKVLLKPNLLSKSIPEKCATTHPAVFQGVLDAFVNEGYEHIKYGDSPGTPLSTPEKVAETCGILDVAKKAGIVFGDFAGGKKVDFPGGRAANNFILCNEMFDTDAIINICKMKTHQLERVTGAVKNLLGCVYGINKGAMHAKYPDSHSFGRMLCDLAALVKPKLHVMDGIMAMEGNGPQSGEPVHMGLILMSKDPVALDSVFCRLVHLNPSIVPTNYYGEQYGLGQMKEENIQIVTAGGREISSKEAVDLFGKADFDVCRDKETIMNLNVLKNVAWMIKKRPAIIKDKCIGCGVCIESCPLEKKAIFWKGEIPKFNYKTCISCYCCQEMCPKEAIIVKGPLGF